MGKNANTIRIAILGAAGRMGRVLSAQVSADPRFELVARIDVRPDDGPALLPAITGSLSAAPEFDILVDFSLPAGTRAALPEMERRRAAWLVAPTGLDDATRARLLVQSRSAPVFISSNTSLGVAIMRHLCRQAAGLLAGWDVEILEAHHSRKVDAPSGTASSIAGDIAASLRERGIESRIVTDRAARGTARDRHEIGISSLRGGTIAGEHTAMWLGNMERLEIRHVAESREIFANGARTIAKWLSHKGPGLYSMQMMLDEMLG